MCLWLTSRYFGKMQTAGVAVVATLFSNPALKSCSQTLTKDIKNLAGAGSAERRKVQAVWRSHLVAGCFIHLPLLFRQQCTCAFVWGQQRKKPVPLLLRCSLLPMRKEALDGRLFLLWSFNYLSVEGNAPHPYGWQCPTFGSHIFLRFLQNFANPEYSIINTL